MNCPFAFMLHDFCAVWKGFYCFKAVEIKEKSSVWQKNPMNSAQNPLFFRFRKAAYYFWLISSVSPVCLSNNLSQKVSSAMIPPLWVGAVSRRNFQRHVFSFCKFLKFSNPLFTDCRLRLCSDYFSIYCACFAYAWFGDQCFIVKFIPKYFCFIPLSALFQN